MDVVADAKVSVGTAGMCKYKQTLTRLVLYQKKLDVRGKESLIAMLARDRLKRIS